MQTRPILMSMLLISTPIDGATLREDSATLRFATACAKCHEGECSGRLSFTRRPEAATAHITQYAGPNDDAFNRLLYDMLERMKTECRYIMPPALRLLNDSSDAQRLQEYRDSWTGGYVIPLGELEAGAYHLTLKTGGNERVRIEVIDDEFDPWLDQCLSPANGQIVVMFELPAAIQVFIRLQPKQKKAISHVGLKLVDQPGRPSMRGLNSIGK